jgi:hypothetical protein
MKAKEIARRIIENLSEADVPTAVATEFAADIQRFNEDVKARHINVKDKASLGAWFRLVRDYNIKWNAVFRELNEDQRFWFEGDWTKPWFKDNDYARTFVDVFAKDAPVKHKQELVDLITKPSAMATAFNRPKTFGPDPEDELRRLLNAMFR